MQNNGSIWRKWDLHIHTPSTKLANNYSNTNESFDTYIDRLENSDVDFFGITDYFNIESYNIFLKGFQSKYPSSTKAFLPNIEFRLDSKNSKDEHIQIHVIFSNDDSTISKIPSFLNRLELVSTGCDGTKRYCCNSDLNSVGYDKAMVSKQILLDTLTSNFNKEEYLIAGVANGYGALRPGSNGDGRGAEYATELDKSCDLFFGNKKNVDFYLNKCNNSPRKALGLHPKPVISGCDAHSFNDIDKKLGKKCTEQSNASEITWIKADPTFEGLKQIIQEPEDRVKIQETKPDDNKTPYSVIKSINFTFDNKNFNKGSLNFNPNLNTIIGGRSTGKSTILQILAYKLLGELKNNGDSDRIKEIADNVSIEWLDGETNSQDRKVEYFPQSYMHNIANDDNERKKIVENIIGKDQLESYTKFISTNQLDIKKDIYMLLEEYGKFKEITKQIHEIGNKAAIEQEISKLQVEINVLMQESKFDEEQKNNFESLKNQLEATNFIKYEIESDIRCLNNSNKKLIDCNYNNDFLELTEKNRGLLERAYLRFATILNNRWKKLITNKIERLENEKIKQSNVISSIENNSDYKKGLDVLKQNTILNDLSNKLRQEKLKLEQVKKLEETKSIHLAQINKLKDNIIERNNQFESKVEELKNQFKSEKTNDVEIAIKSEKFSEMEIFTDLSRSINKQAGDIQNYIANFYQNYHNDKQKHLKDFISKVLNEDLRINVNSNKSKLLESILTTNPYQYKYDLIYQNDNFESMSEGKRAFVILKLLLEYSIKKCPILIDQPEDSLDNRAIYNELVAYIKEKKKDRQIIIVTHNANLVVNADSELVIIANQHGTGLANLNGVKFSYKTGALENTTKNANSNNFLDKKNIKEHICEILEGGEEAFKKRNARYLIIKS
ncbi:MAG TPA: AAA family ATPase [Burkholderiales bacterium]|nr:AAA family ATPase [Burkholderiales bacterium]